MLIPRENNRTSEGAAYLQDNGLSAAARGVLATLLALPKEECISLERLSKIFPNGKSSLSTALSQLEERGYLHREMQHTTDGRFGSSCYRFSGDPIFGERRSDR